MTNDASLPDWLSAVLNLQQPPAKKYQILQPSQDLLASMNDKLLQSIWQAFLEIVQGFITDLEPSGQLLAWWKDVEKTLESWLAALEALATFVYDLLTGAPNATINTEWAAVLAAFGITEDTPLLDAIWDFIGSMISGILAIWMAIGELVGAVLNWIFDGGTFQQVQAAWNNLVELLDTDALGVWINVVRLFVGWWTSEAFASALAILLADYSSFIFNKTASAPGLLNVVAGTGGTLAAGDYWWCVTTLTEGGESTASGQAHTKLAADGSGALSWDFVNGATGYNIYRGTSWFGENVLAGTAAGADTTTFVDEGGGAAGKPPATSSAQTVSQAQLTADWNAAWAAAADLSTDAFWHWFLDGIEIGIDVTKLMRTFVDYLFGKATVAQLQTAWTNLMAALAQSTLDFWEAYFALIIGPWTSQAFTNALAGLVVTYSQVATGQAAQTTLDAAWATAWAAVEDLPSGKFWGWFLRAFKFSHDLGLLVDTFFKWIFGEATLAELTADWNTCLADLNTSAPEGALSAASTSILGLFGITDNSNALTYLTAVLNWLWQWVQQIIDSIVQLFDPAAGTQNDVSAIVSAGQAFFADLGAVATAFKTLITAIFTAIADYTTWLTFMTALEAAWIAFVATITGLEDDAIFTLEQLLFTILGIPPGSPLGETITAITADQEAKQAALNTFMAAVQTAFIDYTTWSTFMTAVEAAWTTYITTVSTLNSDEVITLEQFVDSMLGINPGTSLGSNLTTISEDITALQGDQTAKTAAFTTLLSAWKTAVAGYSTWSTFMSALQSAWATYAATNSTLTGAEIVTLQQLLNSLLGVNTSTGQIAAANVASSSGNASLAADIAALTSDSGGSNAAITTLLQSWWTAVEGYSSWSTFITSAETAWQTYLTTATALASNERVTLQQLFSALLGINTSTGQLPATQVTSTLGNTTLAQDVAALSSDFSTAITTGNWNPLLEALFGSTTVQSTIHVSAVPAGIPSANINIPANVSGIGGLGSGCRFYSTQAAGGGSIGAGSNNTFPAGWYNNEDYCTSDMSFNSSTSQLTVSYAGWYHITIHQAVSNNAYAGYWVAAWLSGPGINKQGPTTYVSNGSTSNWVFGASFNMYLTAGSSIQPRYWCGNSVSNIIVGNSTSSFFEMTLTNRSLF